MRNPGGKGLSRVHPAPFRKGRRGRRVAAKPRLKPARSKESEGIALPAGPGASPKTGGGQGDVNRETLDIKNDQRLNTTEKTWGELERSWRKKKAGKINSASKVPALGNRTEE